MPKTMNIIGVVGEDIDAVSFCQEVDSTSGDIFFEMGSGGGYVTAGILMLNKIRSYDKGKTVARISYAYSMMTQMALACDEVEVYDNAIFMIHNVQGISFGDHRDMKEQAELQERMSESLARLYVQKTGKSMEEIREMMDNDTYLFGQEIVDAGFADRVIESNSKKTKDDMINMLKADYAFTMSASKREKTTFAEVKNSVEKCMGNCNMGNSAAMPTASSDKLANQTIGASMEFNLENFKLQEEQLKVLTAHKETMSTRLETLNVKLENATSALAAKTSELETATAQVESLNSEIGSLKETQTDLVTRVQEGMKLGVSEETLVSMLKAEDATKASEIAMASKESAGATANSSVASEPKDIWAKVEEEKGIK